MDIRLPWACGAVLALSLVTGCASGPRLEGYTAPAMGATWITQVRNTGSFGSGPAEVPGRFVDHVLNGEKLVGFQSPVSTLLARPNGDWVGMLAPDGKMTVSWDPPLRWQWPIEVGKSWTNQYKMKVHAQNREVPYEVKQTVEAYEDVTVPAGTFKAFRVRTESTLGEENVNWFVPELGLFAKTVLVRTDKHPQGPGRRETELKTYTRPARY